MNVNRAESSPTPAAAPAEGNPTLATRVNNTARLALAPPVAPPAPPAHLALTRSYAVTPGDTETLMNRPRDPNLMDID